jgi:hypothetical protein
MSLAYTWSSSKPQRQRTDNKAINIEDCTMAAEVDGPVIATAA